LNNIPGSLVSSKRSDVDSKVVRSIGRGRENGIRGRSRQGWMKIGNR